MKPGRYTLEIQEGGSLQMDVAWSPDGLLADLTGYTARWQIRSTTDATLLHEANTENGGIALGEYTTGDTQFNIRLTLSPADTVAIDVNAVHELWLYQGADFASPIIAGPVDVFRSNLQ